MGGVGGGSPPPQINDPVGSQTKSQNYAFVYTWCFAKQTKYLIFSKLGDVSDSNF